MTSHIAAYDPKHIRLEGRRAKHLQKTNLTSRSFRLMKQQDKNPIITLTLTRINSENAMPVSTAKGSRLEVTPQQTSREQSLRLAQARPTLGLLAPGFVLRILGLGAS